MEATEITPQEQAANLRKLVGYMKIGLIVLTAFNAAIVVKLPEAIYIMGGITLFTFIFFPLVFRYLLNHADKIDSGTALEKESDPSAWYNQYVHLPVKIAYIPIASGLLSMIYFTTSISSYIPFLLVPLCVAVIYFLMQAEWKKGPDQEAPDNMFAVKIGKITEVFAMLFVVLLLILAVLYGYQWSVENVINGAENQ